jgi:hypothetical protein
MGSFYATCSITKTTLSHQRTYIQLLIPTKNYGDEFKGLRLGDERLIFTDWRPFGFPIKGDYYDYGDIDNIVRDKNIEKLENYFNIPIEDIITACGRDGWKDEIKSDVKDVKNLELIEKMTMTYFRGEIYEHLCEGWTDLENSNYWKENFENLKKFEIQDDPEKLKKHILEEYPGLSEEEAGVKILMRSLRNEGRTYISNYRQNDFIRRLGYSVNDFTDDMKKQFQFLNSLSEMYMPLTSSMYGGQQVNWLKIKKMNRYMNRLLSKDMEYYEIDDPYKAQEERADKLEDILK